MRLLLDTHAWLWAVSAPDKLSDAARRAIAGADTTVLVSAASVWEMSIKIGLGRLDLGPDPAATIEAAIASLRATELPVERRHALRVMTLPAHHRDPFDRLLVAQALEEGATLVTADAALRAYPAPLLWAGT